MLLMRHTGIFVDDLQLMKKFYCEKLNLREVVHDFEIGDYIANLYGIDGCSIQVELYKLVSEDGCMIELLKIAPEIGSDVHSDQVFHKGCVHIAFSVNDVNAMYNQLKAEGFEFYSEPLLSRDCMHKVCLCRDPEGNYLELVQDL